MGFSPRAAMADKKLEKMLCAPIEGYAAIFNTPDEAGDSIAPTAFDDFFSGIVIPASGPRVSMLYQHKVDCPIGCWRTFKADQKGLLVSGVLLLGSTTARDVHALVKGGALSGLSIGFRAQSFTRRADGGRHILKAQLWEVSIVTFPMAPQARISAIGGERPLISSVA
ncbi:MAG: HK97 family phage prohead protease [Pseudomonadota bacterium]